MIDLTQETVAMTKTYSVTFFGAQTVEAHDTLVALAEQPCTLEEIRDACDEFDVRADLRDEAGFLRGRVRKGDWKIA